MLEISACHEQEPNSELNLPLEGTNNAVATKQDAMIMQHPATPRRNLGLLTPTIIEEERSLKLINLSSQNILTFTQ